MIREYLKLARISILPLTGLAPVLGGLSTGQSQFSSLVFLFLIGAFAHAYGMTHNDLVDYEIDKQSSEIKDRPLVSGTISVRHAQYFALGCISIMFVVAMVLAIVTTRYLPVLLLFVPIACVTLYNLYGKKFPFADVFLVIGMFFFIMYGASFQQSAFLHLPRLSWIICFLGASLMLLINIIQGGFKDIENDRSHGARTGVMTLGLRISENKVSASGLFKGVAYALQFLTIGIAFFPFLLIPNFASPTTLRYAIILTLFVIGVSTLFITHRYLTDQSFNRGKIRMLFNLQGYLNFICAPILLSRITLFALLIIPLPILGFLLSSLLYKEKFMRPASM